jgi:acetyltransferase-like isoleucine patch superfamily enzyme
MKNLLFKIPLVKKYIAKGYFVRNIRRQLFISKFFKFFFGLHKESSFPVNFTSTVLCPENIVLGEKVDKSFLVSGGSYFQALNGIIIGDNTIFAPGVKFISANHDLKNKSVHVKTSPIKIGKNCWIGTNVVILPGVELADNIIVAAGAVVTKSFKEEGIVLKGIPANV